MEWLDRYCIKDITKRQGKYDQRIAKFFSKKYLSEILIADKIRSTFAHLERCVYNYATVYVLDELTNEEKKYFFDNYYEYYKGGGFYYSIEYCNDEKYRRMYSFGRNVDVVMTTEEKDTSLKSVVMY